MQLTDLVYIKELGHGNFGSVNLVYNNSIDNSVEINKSIEE
jgi:hypothetical protein